MAHRPRHASSQEIVETAGAHDVDLEAVHLRALIDRHLGLRDRAVANDVAGEAAQEVKNADAALEPGAADLDELLRGTLKPRRRHPAIVVPDGREALPVSGIAPQRPVLDHFSNRELVSSQVIIITTSRG